MVSFSTEFPNIAKNIQNCKQITKLGKDQFFEEIDSASHTTRENMREHAEDYFRANKLRGEIINDPKDLTRLGHLHQWTMLLLNPDVMEALEDAPFDIRDYQDAVRIEDWDKLEELLECLEGIPINNYVMWGFLSNDNLPFQGLEMENLPCRLALDSILPDVYFPFELQVPTDADVRETTAFDAGFFDRWCPGGWTCPRHECNDEDPLREAVVPGLGMPGGWVTFDLATRPRF